MRFLLGLLTREQLDAIRARVEAAKTEEGWEPVHTIHKKNYVDDTYTGFQACCPIVFCGEYGDRSSDDANELSYAHMDLIGNAPTDLRTLLAEVERLRRELDKATDDHIESQRNGAREAIARKALLAEVERLKAEVESKVAQNVALIGQNGRLQLEVERLTTALAEPPNATTPVVEWETDSFFLNQSAQLDEERFVGVAKGKILKGWYWTAGGYAATEQEAKAAALALAENIR